MVLGVVSVADGAIFWALWLVSVVVVAAMMVLGLVSVTVGTTS